MRVKITHDGSFDCASGGTTIVNADTGEPIGMVSRIDIVLDAMDGPSAILYVASPQVDMVIDTRIETEQTLIYDPGDNDSLDQAIALLQARRAARNA
jgi:hypothetical protein